MNNYEVNNTLNRMYHEVLFAYEHGYSVDACDFSNLILSERTSNYVNVLRALIVDIIKRCSADFSRGDMDGKHYVESVTTYKIMLGILDA